MKQHYLRRRRRATSVDTTLLSRQYILIQKLDAMDHSFWPRPTNYAFRSTLFSKVLLLLFSCPAFAHTEVNILHTWTLIRCSIVGQTESQIRAEAHIISYDSLRCRLTPRQSCGKRYGRARDRPLSSRARQASERAQFSKRCPRWRRMWVRQTEN